jgi:hypothetical protein
MKRKWRGMSIKRKKNSNESQQVETSLYFLSLDEGEVVHPCFPPAQEVEGAIEDPIEAALASDLPTHKEK